MSTSIHHPLRVYVAGPLAYAMRSAEVAEGLTSAGFEVVSSWIPAALAENGELRNLQARATRQAQNEQDIRRADVLLALTAEGTPRATFAEIGFALALECPVLWFQGVAGEGENLFDANMLVKVELVIHAELSSTAQERKRFRDRVVTAVRFNEESYKKMRESRCLTTYFGKRAQTPLPVQVDYVGGWCIGPEQRSAAVESMRDLTPMELPGLDGQWRVTRISDGDPIRVDAVRVPKRSEPGLPVEAGAEIEHGADVSPASAPAEEPTRLPTDPKCDACVTCGCPGAVQVDEYGLCFHCGGTPRVIAARHGTPHTVAECPEGDNEPAPVVPPWLAGLTPEAVARINAIPATGPAPWDIAPGALAAAIKGPTVEKRDMKSEATSDERGSQAGGLPSPAHGQRYTCADEEGFTLSHPEPGRTDARYWITVDGRVVDMYAVSTRSGWRVEVDAVRAPVAASAVIASGHQIGSEGWRRARDVRLACELLLVERSILLYLALPALVDATLEAICDRCGGEKAEATLRALQVSGMVIRTHGEDAWLSSTYALARVAQLEREHNARCASCGTVVLGSDVAACRTCGNGDATAEQTIASLRARVAELEALVNAPVGAALDLPKADYDAIGRLTAIATLGGSVESAYLREVRRVREREAKRTEEAKRKLDDAVEQALESIERERVTRAQLRVASAGVEDVWKWAGDGEDHPESLSCPVVMSAERLRDFVAAESALAALTTAPSPLDGVVAEVCALLPSIHVDDNHGAINRIIIEAHDAECGMGDDGGDAVLRAARIKIAALALAGMASDAEKRGE